MQKVRYFSDHVIVCGFSNVSQTIIDEFRKTGAPFVFVEDRADISARLRAKGYDVIEGNPTLRETLGAAGMATARALICAHDADATNVLIAVTARDMRPEKAKRWPRVIVRVEDEENIAKLQHLGADEVISPSTLGGQLMAEKAMSAGGRVLRQDAETGPSALPQ